MFHHFNNLWTPVLSSSELGRRRPIGIQLAGDHLVLFRDEQGRPAALLDRCPHRGVALSLGTVESGRIRCPFHGWEFDHSGENCHVPWNPEAHRDRLCSTAFPTRELGGQVWVHTGQVARSEPETDEVFLSPRVRVSAFTLPVEAHWTRVMENMLDWPHLPFVHQTTIGRPMVKSAMTSRMDIQLDDRPYGFTTRIKIDGADQPGRLDYRFPNAMVLHILSGKQTLVMQVACVPESDTRTRMVLTTARSFLKSRLFDPIFHYQNRKIAFQDKAIVESSWPVAVPRASEERSVRTDAPTLRFRKIYFERLATSNSAAADVPIQLKRLSRGEARVE
jgi:phenylpropionate dioxygenase-like ring-hydroxylating dioxygenase large terminal subunit